MWSTQANPSASTKTNFVKIAVSLRPSLTRGRTEFTYYPGMARIPEGSAPDFKNKSYRITADVDIPAGGAEGMLLTQGAASMVWAYMSSKASLSFTTT